MKIIRHIILGFVVTAALVIVILFCFPQTDPATIILSAINLFLVYGYVLATIEIVKLNRTNINYLKTASLSSMIALKKPEETGGEINKNQFVLVITNNSDNNAREVKIKVTAIFNSRRDVSSSPYDGTFPVCVQARQSYLHTFKIQDEFLSRAGLTMDRMIELANESNERNQFIIEVDVSFLDGFGERFNNPQLKWYFSFLKKEWNFIG